MEAIPIELKTANRENDMDFDEATMGDDLLQAATQGKVDLLRRLLDNNGDDVLQQKTPIKDTAIHVAARNGRLEFVKYAHARCPSLTYLIQSNSKGDTLFHIAARAGHVEMVRLLIHCVKNTALPIDVERGNLEVILELLRKQNNKGDTAMHDAVRNPRFEAVKLLIAADPELLCLVNDAGESPLHVAVEKGDRPIVEEILQVPKYSDNGPNGRTALHASIINQKLAIAELLLEKDKRLARVSDDNYRSPLHFATTLGSFKLVKLLLLNDKSTTSLWDRNGLAPIHIAALYGRIDMIKEFIRCCPDLIHLLDKNGRNILHMAIEGHETHLISYILRKKKFDGALNEKDNNGNTPLHQATSSGQPYVVNLLVRNKRVDLSAVNNEGCSALGIAMSQSGREGNKPGKVLVELTLLRFAKPTWCSRLTSWGEVIRHPILRQYSREWYKNKSNTLMVVAALVATVTFAAGFTLPGGYHDDGVNEGKPILRDRSEFGAFVVFDALALYSSVMAVSALFVVHFIDSIVPVIVLFYCAQILTMLSLYFLVTAFVYGVILTVTEDVALSNFIVNGGSLCLIVCVGLVIILLQPFLPFLYCSKRYVYVRSWIDQTVFGTVKPRNSYTQRLNDVSMLLNYKQKTDGRFDQVTTQLEDDSM